MVIQPLPGHPVPTVGKIQIRTQSTKKGGVPLEYTGKVMEISGDFYKNVRGKFMSGIKKALFDRGLSEFFNSLLALFFYNFENRNGWFSAETVFSHRKIRESVPFIGISPHAGTHQAAQSQMLCRAATSLLLQAHHRMRGWLQRARGATARKSQQSQVSGTCPNHTRQPPL